MIACQSGMPEAHRVVSAPLAVLGAEPGRRALRPIPAIILRLADAHIGEHDAARAVGLALHSLDVRPGEGAVISAVIDHHHVRGQAGDRAGVDVLQLIVPALDAGGRCAERRRERSCDVPAVGRLPTLGRLFAEYERRARGQHKYCQEGSSCRPMNILFAHSSRPLRFVATETADTD